MHTPICAIPLKQLLMKQILLILASLTIAELFYKNHRFTLEAVAFLATWGLFNKRVTRRNILERRLK